LGCKAWGVVARAAGAKVAYSEAFDDKQSVAIESPQMSLQADTKQWRISLNSDLLAYLDVSDERVAKALLAVLNLWEGDSLSREQLLKLDVPDVASFAAWAQKIADYDAGGSQAALSALFDALDEMVGTAFGLSADQIKAIQIAMQTDSFLRNIRPNLPFAGRAQRGLSSSLAASDRYEGEAH
jgi:hypothetical protein